MTATLRLADSLAAELSRRAARSNRSIEDEATRLIGRALVASDDEDWEEANQRRFVLLHKSASAPLDPREQRELEDLQLLADRRLERLDAERLDEVQRMQSQVDALLGPAS